MSTTRKPRSTARPRKPLHEDNLDKVNSKKNNKDNVDNEKQERSTRGNPFQDIYGSYEATIAPIINNMVAFGLAKYLLINKGHIITYAYIGSPITSIVLPYIKFGFVLCPLFLTFSVIPGISCLIFLKCFNINSNRTANNLFVDNVFYFRYISRFCNSFGDWFLKLLCLWYGYIFVQYLLGYSNKQDKFNQMKIDINDEFKQGINAYQQLCQTKKGQLTLIESAQILRHTKRVILKNNGDNKIENSQMSENV